MTTLTAPSSAHSDEQLDAMFDEAALAVQQAPAAAIVTLHSIRDEAVRRNLAELAAQCDYLAARAHVNLGELTDALDGIEAAEARFLAAGLAADAARTGLGKMHVLDDLGRHDAAIDVGRDLLGRLPELRRRAPDTMLDRLEAAALENIGVSNGSLGHHATALQAYERAEHLYVAADLHLDAVRCMANRGVELIELDRLGEAVDALHEAGAAFAAADDHLDAGMCAAHQAKAHLHRGDFLEAHRLGLVAETFLGDAEPTTEFARSQLIRAETLVALNLVDEAHELYEQLDARFSAAGLAHDAAIATLGRANVLLRTGRVAEAAAAFAESERRFAEVGDRAMQPACRLGASIIADDRTAFDVALAAAAEFASLGRRGDEIVAVLRAIDISGRVDDATTGVAVRTSLLDRCDALLGAEPLPHLSWQVRRAHGRLANDTGDLDAALAHLDIAASEIERLRRSVSHHVSLVPFMGSRRDVHEDLVATHLARGDVATALALVTAARARTLTETRSTTASDSTASVGEVERFDVQITFEVVGSEILAFVGDRDGLRAVRNLTTTRIVERLLGRLAAQWRRFDGNVLADHDAELLMASTLDLLQRLHDELLRPLDIAADADGIVIVPVGLMANVPFAALHDGDRHLVEWSRVAIAAFIDESNERNNRIVGADVVPRRMMLGIPDAAAPHIADEIQAIAALGNARTFIGSEATADALFDAAADADIIHIACHGFHRSDRPSLSSLRLADRDVTALEINRLGLDGQFIVLSACSSGRQHASGNIDELMGLPRTFLAAGAAGVLANLWRVDDTASAHLMSDLHSRLADEAPAAALRSAQLHLRARQPHPYYWAAAVAYVNVNRLPRQETT